MKSIVPIVAWVYTYQLAGIVHLSGHALVARFYGVDSRVVWPWQRLVPIWGWYWNLTQPHDVMMVHVDLNTLHSLEPSAKIQYGYAGICIQLAYMLVIGGVLKPYKVVNDLVPFNFGYSLYANGMFMWTLMYMYGYAIHFYDDPTADFALFSAGCRPANVTSCVLF